jgi:hypothetical protein
MQGPSTTIGPVLLVIFVSALVVVRADEPKAEHAPTGLEGTWRMVSNKIGDAERETLPNAQTTLRLMTATHFMWTTYDEKTREPLVRAGGTYTRRGGNLTERYTFASKPLAGLLAGEWKLECKVEGNRWYHSGTASGLKFKQVWERVE